MTEMSPLAALVLALVTAFLIWFGVKRSARRILEQQFSTDIDPAGPLVECQVRFVPDEASTPCGVRSTPDGWYMCRPPSAIARRYSISGVPFLKRPMLIPWPLLEYHYARFPLHRWLRFDVPSAKATFFVRQNVAMDLLRDAGRPPPPDR
jgi:hypothetical protein